MTRRYRDVRVLAGGGMAEIVLARESLDDGAERTVVIKRVLRHLCREQEFLAMFASEARLAMQLHHPNVVEVVDAGESDGIPFLVMEALDGADLRTILRDAFSRRTRLPVGVACAIAADVARGLQYAHALRGTNGQPLGVVHRDVSPHNVFVTRDGRVKLLDFGIARSAEQLNVTRTGVFKGKVGYAAPEQMSAMRIDARADLYSLGAVLWEMLTTRKLWRGENAAFVAQAVMSQSPPPPSSIASDVPPKLDAIVMALLARAPASRPASASAIVDALDAIAREKGVTDRASAIAALFEHVPANNVDRTELTVAPPPGNADPTLSAVDHAVTDSMPAPIFADEQDDLDDAQFPPTEIAPLESQPGAVAMSRSRRVLVAIALAASVALLAFGFARARTPADPPRAAAALTPPAHSEPVAPVPTRAPPTPPPSVVPAAGVESTTAPDASTPARAVDRPPAVHTTRHGVRGTSRDHGAHVLEGGAIRDYP